MLASFRTATGRIIPIEIDPEYTSKDVKEYISDKVKIKPEVMKLSIKMKEIPEGVKFSQLGITKDTTISVLSTTSKARMTRSLNANRALIQKKPASMRDITLNTKSDDPDNFLLQVNTLHELGYPEKECKKALRASCYNIDRAAEYLILDKIPQNDSLTLSAPAKTERLLRRGSMPVMSEREIGTITNLANATGADKEIVIQVFNACDKDEEKTIACLNTMK